MDALKIVKRISNTHLGHHHDSAWGRRTKKAISESVDKLRESMQVDVNNVMKNMLAETDEKKQLKNVDFIFRVCIPLYFLSDVSKRSGGENETI